MAHVAETAAVRDGRDRGQLRIQIGELVAGLEHALRRAAQPKSGFSPRLEASDRELVYLRYGVPSTSACPLSRGKGVLAA